MEEELIEHRKNKLRELVREGINPYSNSFKVDTITSEIQSRFSLMPAAELEEIEERFSIAGRVIALRDFGKAAFLSILDRKGKMQVYLRKDKVSEKDFCAFKGVDVGDFAGVRGRLFRTKTEELSVLAEEFKILTKSVRPLPEKWHGLTDIELRYRKRYLDLLSNPSVKDTFYKRAKIIQFLRNFLLERDFMEVETPILQPLPGGAVARPFKTFHHTLQRELYLRIAPELYLKRLVVGGLERVFEINKSFRNEGISTLHNPEFTMLEFYQAFVSYQELMKTTEEMLSSLALEIQGSYKFPYLEEEIDFSPPFRRINMREAILAHSDLKEADLRGIEKLREIAALFSIPLEKTDGEGKILTEIFSEIVEPHLIQPTFIIRFPAEVSPLSRRCEDNPEEVERFELFIAGKEIANAFSELNDPFDQRERFLKQLAQRKGEDSEIPALDEDFLCSLEHGMPPTAGEGIGIDRLVMLLTNSSSIRDVILFPTFKK